MTKLDEARACADDFLFPTANDVDAAPIVPRERLDRLAADGWYGIASPASNVPMTDAWPILAAFTGGCATTTLVWMQHFGVIIPVAFGPDHLRDELLEPLAAGDVRGTVAYAGLLPDPKLRSRLDGDTWVIDGTAPWMSGWSEWPERDAMRINGNGAMAIGVAERCARLIGSDALLDDIAEAAAALDTDDVATFPAGRARASALAVRAASMLVAHEGSASANCGTNAERLYREAGMLLVYATRPSIRAELLSSFGS